MKTGNKLTLFVLSLTVAFVLGYSAARAQDNFFAGKAVRWIVGFSAGGGYDTYTRLVARHMGKHVPGNPAMLVENMTGAGSMIAANYVYKAAAPDGLTIGHFIGGLFLQQLLEKPGIEFDARKFEYVGVPGQDNFILFVSKRTGFNSLQDWINSKKVIKFGGVASGSGTNDIPNILKATLGLPIQLVSGYKGTSVIRLAFNSGEVDGLSNSWESTKATWRKEHESGEIKIMIQANVKSHPELKNIPVAYDLAKSAADKKLIETIVKVHGAAVRPYVLPPGTPKGRVETLQKAFMATVNDPELLAEAKKAKLDMNPTSGAELKQNVLDILAMDPNLVAKLKEILK